MEALFSKRELLEGQESITLINLKAQLLERLSDIEAEVHLINEVLDGQGVDRESSSKALGALGIVEASR